MKVTFLGTSSTEGIPGVFCNCKVCKEVKQRGGRDIRTRTQAIVDDGLLVDFGPDTYMNAVKNRLNLSQLEGLLITHSHADHFCPQQLQYRYAPFAHGLKREKLEIFCNAKVREIFDKVGAATDITQNAKNALNFNTVKTFRPYKIAGYTVTPFPSTHMTTEESLIYLIEKGDSAYFYGNDTGIPQESIYGYLKEKGKKLTLVSLDCALGTSDFNYKWHLNYYQCVEIKDKMLRLGIAGENTKFVITHISHDYHHRFYQDYAEFAAKDGFLVAYGGMELDV